MKRNTMRKLIYLAIFILGGCVITDGSSNNNEKHTKLPADGKSVDIKSFKAIRADGVFNIFLSQGSKEGVVVKGDYPQGLKISNSGDTLVITDTINVHLHNSNFHFDVKTDIYITLNDINSLDIESVGATKCTDTLKLKNLNFNSEGVGTTTLWLNADTVKGSEDGVGALELAGKATYADISDNGIGKLESGKFLVDVLHVNVNGIGAADVYASREIYIQSSGVGGVTYRGPAKVMQADNDGVGGVNHAD